MVSIDRRAATHEILYTVEHTIIFMILLKSSLVVFFFTHSISRRFQNCDFFFFISGSHTFAHCNLCDAAQKKKHQNVFVIYFLFISFSLSVLNTRAFGTQTAIQDYFLLFRIVFPLGAQLRSDTANANGLGIGFVG